MTTYRYVDTVAALRRKRGGEPLDGAVLHDLVAGYLAGGVSEGQMAAFLMAGAIRGFEEAEAVALTTAMARSGRRVDLSAALLPTADKHSTGGVGDTTTLVVAPLVAACGLAVAKLAGGALGHTGGTLDKLRAIPGFRVDLPVPAFQEQVARIGLAIAAPTRDLAPADRQLYALRDATATVDVPALIAASVMSKKLAAGAGHIVLDVKTGGGAFVPEPAEATTLAELCVAIGEAGGRRTGALVTDMSQPLGKAVGGSLEVAAAVDLLHGGPDGSRLSRLVEELSTALLVLAGRSRTDAAGDVTKAWTSGRALGKFREMVVAQGGAPEVVSDPWSVLEAAPLVATWEAPAGFVQGIDCRALGELARGLAGGWIAGGRHDPAPGLEVLVSVGQEVGPGRPAVRIHARREEDAERAVAVLPALFDVGDRPTGGPRLVSRRVGL